MVTCYEKKNQSSLMMAINARTVYCQYVNHGSQKPSIKICRELTHHVNGCFQRTTFHVANSTESRNSHATTAIRVAEQQ